jgi:DNA-binding LacI/PurR family transcriptional regulator
MVDVVRFLHQNNYKNFVYVTPPKSIATTTEERINGFNHGLFKYYGLARANNLLMITNDLDAQVKKITKYLQKYPETEVIVTMGVQTSAVIIAAAKLGIRIPQDLKLMLFDDEMSLTEKDTYKPYIIKQDSYNMGYLAAEALYNQIYGDMRITVKKLPISISTFGEKDV